MFPNLNEEKILWNRGYKIVAGLDEAGRGPLAGQVVAAAVAINPKSQIPIFNQHLKSQSLKNNKSINNLGLNGHWGLVPGDLLKNVKDSKQLSARKREMLYKSITQCSQIKWGIGIASEKIIDEVNILEATKLAMIKAIRNLKIKPGYLILDGKMKLNLDIPQKSIIKGDSKVFSCAAASILAKVTRDRIMIKLHKKYPQYGFDIHKGYPTKHHIKMIKKYGPCKIHRKSFGPVKAHCGNLAKP